MSDYKNLIVWKKSHEFVLKIYKISSSFPRDEQYGITSQIRRASISMPSNIAEGSARGSDADFARFLRIALGSANEVDYLLLLAKEISIIKPEIYKQLSIDIDEISKMLSSFVKKLKANN